ncbi:MAG: hypothetical protein G01um10148_415 [Parcubacteria group bacterium Gr01-1014_8]|nr:MAG: hypothetical protein G01um10148_415 [Parcubacteria group bacterium Gr01-1014_8]
MLNQYHLLKRQMYRERNAVAMMPLMGYNLCGTHTYEHSKLFHHCAPQYHDASRRLPACAEASAGRRGHALTTMSIRNFSIIAPIVAATAAPWRTMMWGIIVPVSCGFFQGGKTSEKLLYPLFSPSPFRTMCAQHAIVFPLS